MAEYIDRQEVIETLAFYREDPDGVDHALNSIKSIPSADVAPVVHGQWDGYETCSVCGASKSYFFYCTETGDWDGDWNYCPNCGADMRGG